VTETKRDPAAVEFERQVRHDATVAHAQALHRMRILKGSARTWWAVREMLRQRREERN